MGRKSSIKAITEKMEGKTMIDDIFKSKELLDKLLVESKAEEIIEKFVILGFIFDPVFINALKFEQRNTFQETIFASLFKDWSYEQVLLTIEKFENQYQKHFNSLLNAEIERISVYTPIESSTRKETTPHRLRAEKVLELAS